MQARALARRQFLRGAGGVTVGLPFLPSLASRSFAADPVAPRPRHFVAFTSEHGGVLQPNMWPADAALTDKTTLFAGHDIWAGKLTRTVVGSNAVLSPVLTAPASQLSDRLVSKLNVLRGVDIAFGIAHHGGGHLGNYARNDGNGDEGRAMQAFPFPTIDQVMGWSPAFYGSLDGIRERVMVTGDDKGISWNWSSPATKSGSIQRVAAQTSSRALFDRIFVPPPSTGTPAPARRPIVDKVLANYRRLRDGSSRLSAADRQRLDDHMDRLAELQRRVDTTGVRSCAGVKTPTDDSANYREHDAPDAGKAYYQLINDVIVAAFSCGTSRIAAVAVQSHFDTFAGSWHQDVAHQGTEPSKQQLLVGSHRRIFADVFLDLAAKLDAIETSPGVTLLDDSLVQWTHESGFWTHESVGIPLVTAGGAGGFLRTGLYCDYRNRRFPLWGEARFECTGLTYNRWMATALQAMGLPRSSFERDGVPGYGHPMVGTGWKNRMVPQVTSSAGDVMPLLGA